MDIFQGSSVVGSALWKGLVHLLQENKKGARHMRREKVRENKRRSREKKRHLKKLLKMKEVFFFIFTDGYALSVICGLPEQ